MTTVRNIVLALAILLVACERGAVAPNAVGQLSSERIELRADAAEILVERDLPEGASIDAGIIVARQSNTLATLRLAEARADLAARRANLDELTNGARPEQLAAARADHEGAEEQLKFRRDEWSRQRRLRERGLNSIDDLDAAEAAFDQARADEAAASARLEELTNGTRAETLARAEAELAAVDARVKRLGVELERLSLRAPSDAVLDRYVAEVGERISTGELVAILLSGQQPKARIYVPAEFRPSISAGGSVRVTVDGYDNAFVGEVDWIAADAAFTPYFALNERDRSRLTYLAEITVQHDGPRLADGLPVTVEWDTP
ncbi:MAG: HlyD family efflux transporter periplasmic adaptor subunit [Pseudomonadota bacterium]